MLGRPFKIYVQDPMFGLPKAEIGSVRLVRRSDFEEDPLDPIQDVSLNAEIYLSRYESALLPHHERYMQVQWVGQFRGWVLPETINMLVRDGQTVLRFSAASGLELLDKPAELFIDELSPSVSWINAIAFCLRKTGILLPIAVHLPRYTHNQGAVPPEQAYYFRTIQWRKNSLTLRDVLRELLLRFGAFVTQYGERWLVSTVDSLYTGATHALYDIETALPTGGTFVLPTRNVLSAQFGDATVVSRNPPVRYLDVIYDPGVGERNTIPNGNFEQNFAWTYTNASRVYTGDTYAAQIEPGGSIEQTVSTAPTIQDNWRFRFLVAVHQVGSGIPTITQYPVYWTLRVGGLYYSYATNTWTSTPTENDFPAAVTAAWQEFYVDLPYCPDAGSLYVKFRTEFSSEIDHIWIDEVSLSAPESSPNRPVYAYRWDSDQYGERALARRFLHSDGPTSYADGAITLASGELPQGWKQTPYATGEGTSGKNLELFTAERVFATSALGRMVLSGSLLADQDYLRLVAQDMGGRIFLPTSTEFEAGRMEIRGRWIEIRNDPISPILAPKTVQSDVIRVVTEGNFLIWTQDTNLSDVSSSVRPILVRGQVQLAHSVSVFQPLFFEPQGRIVLSAGADLRIYGPIEADPYQQIFIPEGGKVRFALRDAYVSWFSGSQDITQAFRIAALSVNDWIETGQGPSGTVRIPAGTWEITAPLPARDVHIVGAGWDNTRIQVKFSAAGSAAIDQQLERNGVSAQKQDGGRCRIENLTIERHPDLVYTDTVGIRTYGDGHVIRQVRIRGMYDGITIELPITVTLDHVYAHQCIRYGFHVKQAVVSGQTPVGTSLSMRSCWAYLCGQNGFRIETIVYSTFQACVSQECGFSAANDSDDGAFGWLLAGNLYGEGPLNTVALIACASEGDRRGIRVKRARNIIIEAPKFVGGSLGPKDALIEFGDATGVIAALGWSNPPSTAQSHFAFMPDPNYPNLPWDNSGQIPVVTFVHSGVIVRPLGSAHVNDEVLRRIHLSGSRILNADRRLQGTSYYPAQNQDVILVHSPLLQLFSQLDVRLLLRRGSTGAAILDFASPGSLDRPVPDFTLGTSSGIDGGNTLFVATNFLPGLGPIYHAKIWRSPFSGLSVGDSPAPDSSHRLSVYRGIKVTSEWDAILTLRRGSSGGFSGIRMGAFDEWELGASSSVSNNALYAAHGGSVHLVLETNGTMFLGPQFVSSSHRLSVYDGGIVARPEIMVVDNSGTAKLTGSGVDKVQPNTIGTTQLIDEAVTTPKLANGAVTTPKLAVTKQAGMFVNSDWSGYVEIRCSDGTTVWVPYI
ncbi:MAG: hypothetical protein QXT77_01020 [Candidatus Methanomethylicaceae archaeon]